MDGAKPKKKTVLPNLGRKWDAVGKRWTVVLKVEKWDKGTLLMCEAPLAMCCGYQRPMGLVQEQDPDADDQDAEQIRARNRRIVENEAARVKRWLHAQKLKWTTEQILLNEVLLYCHERSNETDRRAQRQRQRPQKNKKQDSKAPIGPAEPPAPPAPATVGDDNLDKYLPAAEWLFKERAYDTKHNDLNANAKSASNNPKAKSGSNDADAKSGSSGSSGPSGTGVGVSEVRAALAGVLKETSFWNHTMFSRVVKGCGWYPLLGHVRQVKRGEGDGRINAMVCFQNSNAYLIPMVDLKRGDELIIADNRQETDEIALFKTPAALQDLPTETIAAIRHLFFPPTTPSTASAAPILNEICWQWLTKLVATFGKPALDRLFDQSRANPSSCALRDHKLSASDGDRKTGLAQTTAPTTVPNSTEATAATAATSATAAVKNSTATMAGTAAVPNSTAAAASAPVVLTAATAGGKSDAVESGAEYRAFLGVLKEATLVFLRTQWLKTETKKLIGMVPDNTRIEFLLIYIQELLNTLQPPQPAPAPPKLTQEPTPTPKTDGAKIKSDNKDGGQDNIATPTPKTDGAKIKSDNKDGGQDNIDGKNKNADKDFVDGKSDGKGDGKKGGGMDMPALEDFLSGVGVVANAREAPAIRSFDEQLSPSEWQLYQQLVVLANRRLMIYDLLPVLQNDPLALAYHQLWHEPKIALPGNAPPKISLMDRWNNIAQKLAQKHPSLLDKD